MGARKAGEGLTGARKAEIGHAGALDREALERLYLKYNERRFIPSDPVKYDFALIRFGMLRSETEEDRAGIYC